MFYRSLFMFGWMTLFGLGADYLSKLNSNAGLAQLIMLVLLSALATFWDYQGGRGNTNEIALAIVRFVYFLIFGWFGMWIPTITDTTGALLSFALGALILGFLWTVSYPHLRTQ